MHGYRVSLCFLLCFHQCIGISDARPAEPGAQMPGSPATDLSQSVSRSHKGQSRDLALALQNTSSEPIFNAKRFFITPNLTIRIALRTPVGNTTALSVVLCDAKAYAQNNIDHYGGSEVIPGRILRTVSGVEYDVKPPRSQALSSFTWAHFEALTDWLYNYLVVVGYEASCWFRVNKVWESGREFQIGFGRIHVVAKLEGGPRNRLIWE